MRLSAPLSRIARFACAQKRISMIDQPTPGFPYTMLVRVPLFTTLPLALLIVWQMHFPRRAAFPPYTWGDRGVMAVQQIFLLGALVQIVAIPLGIARIRGSSDRATLRQALAVACGAADLALMAFGVLRGSLVSS
jgi:hypothetical protein